VDIAGSHGVRLGVEMQGSMWHYGHMASRKVTTRERVREREKRLSRACEIVNSDLDVRAVEREWGAFSDEVDAVAEPWKDAPAR